MTRLRQSEIQFIRGYHCCLAAILQSHGDDTYVAEAIRRCGSKEEILRYADEGDIQIYQQHGYLLDESNNL